MHNKRNCLISRKSNGGTLGVSFCLSNFGLGGNGEWSGSLCPWVPVTRLDKIVRVTLWLCDFSPTPVAEEWEARVTAFRR